MTLHDAAPEAIPESRVPGTDAPASTEATLIYNTNAGGSERSSPDHLVEALHQLGYHPVYRATDSEADLVHALREVEGTVFVAGGDGTIRAATLHLAGREGVVLGIIPMGTANNIGRTLGIQGDPLDVIAGYRGAQVQPFDLGRVTAPWGEDVFLEAFGCGAFAEVLAEYNPDDGKSPLRAVQALGTALSAFDPTPIVLTLDGTPEPDETPYALLEILNTRATGPRLRLATTADTSDGLLDVIRIDAAHRDGMLTYLAALARDDFEALPSVLSGRAQVIEIPYHGQAFHVDGEVHAPEQGAVGSIRVECWAGALRVLVPGTPVDAVATPSQGTTL
ncbi:diacylglycerol kinase family lipid kinase [Deinococcus sp. KSM4-11]|uniref:diacylglycerol/lipid kinase family protein n=1 Tax=Deinococcus sp. KSM4-11 TaxID=2568654 RepID=UPI0010A300A2|nr:diacylglycerol kinase family protein [Deinococcus sp. KSM4-11]THF84932.1 diacylglycerol kinase family lipid kinase [Deinococcus sp. KSM4-11]